MIEYTLESPKWKPGKGRASFYLDHLAADLVGLNFGARILKDQKYGPLLTRLLPTLSRWGGCVAGFLRSSDLFCPFSAN